MRDVVEARLAPFHDVLGADREAYTNHVLRVLALCDALHDSGGAGLPSSREEFVVAAVFHDLGIWTAGTFDYLAPSADLARAHAGGADADLVTRMVEEHHKLRSAGEPQDPVELFRRADTIDVTLGLRRFGLGRHVYRDIATEYPNAGFHQRLAQLTLEQVRRHPLHPAPMFRW